MSSNEPRWIGTAIETLDAVLTSKNQDYRIAGEFSNFEYAADVAGEVGGAVVTTEQIIITQLAIKLGRLQGLPADPNNESRLDTLKDLAGYAIILYAHALSLSDEDV